MDSQHLTFPAQLFLSGPASQSWVLLLLAGPDRQHSGETTIAAVVDEASTSLGTKLHA